MALSRISSGLIGTLRAGTPPWANSEAMPWEIAQICKLISLMGGRSPSGSCRQSAGARGGAGAPRGSPRGGTGKGGGGGGGGAAGEPRRLGQAEAGGSILLDQ